LKVASENAVQSAVLGRVLICRPGLVVGPGDRSGRFTYWAERLATDGEVLAPGGPEDPVQMIDVRDLAAWLVASIETGRVGVFDATSPPMSRRDFFAAVGGPDVDERLTWVDQEFLVEHTVVPWMGPRSLPLWLPLPEYTGFLARNVDATIEAGMTFRPLAQTAQDTVAWAASDPAPVRTGLTRDEESQLLAEWHRRNADDRGAGPA
jgi:nucleoside-diphosphate-sugar epimerase